MNDLRPKYAGKIKMEIIAIDTKRGKRGQDKYGMHHGMVILNKEGEVYWKKPGHKMDREEITSRIEGILNQ